MFVWIRLRGAEQVKLRYEFVAIKIYDPRESFATVAAVEAVVAVMAVLWVFTKTRRNSLLVGLLRARPSNSHAAHAEDLMLLHVL